MIAENFQLQLLFNSSLSSPEVAGAAKVVTSPVPTHRQP